MVVVVEHRFIVLTIKKIINPTNIIPGKHSANELVSADVTGGGVAVGGVMARGNGITKGLLQVGQTVSVPKRSSFADIL